MFVYMLAPVLHRIKESELQSYRLENGLKLWRALWEHRHPDAVCFTTYCKLNPHHVWARRLRSDHPSFDVLPGRKFFSFSFFLFLKIKFFISSSCFQVKSPKKKIMFLIVLKAPIMFI